MGDLIALHSSMTRGCSQVGTGLFPLATNDSKRGQSVSLGQGMVSLDISRNFYMGRVVKHWKQLPKVVIESPSMEVAKEGLDISLSPLGWVTTLALGTVWT